ncbi:spn-E, partial [Symbiodinium sp. CCMP2456]
KVRCGCLGIAAATESENSELPRERAGSGRAKRAECDCRGARAAPSSGRSRDMRIGPIVCVERKPSDKFKLPRAFSDRWIRAQTGEASAGPRAPPAWTAAQAVRDALRRSQVICIQGETGCGKSSVMPMVFLEDPKGKIAVTQPRRIAAISLAQRVASQCQEAVGETVGYRVAMDGKVSESTRLSFVTTGWLLMYLAHRPQALRHYTHIVLDEIHERDLDMDLLCLLLKRSLEKNPSLRLVLMSATVDATQFLDFFSGQGVQVERKPIVVGARRFPTYPYFLDDLVNGALPGFIPRVRLDRFDKIGGRVEVNPQLFEASVGIVQAVAKPGLCVLIFLPLAEDCRALCLVSQARALRDRATPRGLLDLPRRGQCPLVGTLAFVVFRVPGHTSHTDFHMLHSVVPHEQQKKALLPPPARRSEQTSAGHCKVVLSTNIAESSITIPDVRYVLDFGIVRKMVFDEERAMQSLCNTWSSQATCRQRRGRCGRLQEGVIVYLFPRSHYDRLQAYASPEVLGVPLESIYLKSRVLLHHLGPPEDLLQQLIDSPPQQRIAAAAQNLQDLGALKADGEVASLGRIAVFMPTTIQLTKLVVLSWALGIPGDGVVIAAALSTQDVFKMAAPANCRNLEDFPAHLAHNYITRARFDDGQFSEPIMYRNLYKEFLTVSKTQARAYHSWLDQSCVSVSRMSQFAALVVELAAKLGAAVPSAKAHPALQALSRLKRSHQLKPEEVEGLFTKDYVRLKFALVGAFQPSFVQGEINTQNKNKGKINNCGFDPMRTCLLQQIKPAEMADVNNLWEFCHSLAPTKDVSLNDTGKIAFIECGDDREVHVPQSDVVHQMPLVAQLLHQLMRQPCKFKVLSDQGIWHEASKIGSPNFLNGMKWHVNGMRTMGSPYWRSNMGYMCEMRGNLKCHWGVCSSLLGREGPDQVRITGLTILPPPGTMSGTVMILAFLNGPFKVTFLGDPGSWVVIAWEIYDTRGRKGGTSSLAQAEKELCETRVWRRDGLDVTRGSTRKFAEAHNSLRRGAAQFYIMNSFVLALPSLLELVFAARNFSSACGWATAAWMTVDSVVCLFGSLLSLWLCLQAQVLQDLELQEHLVRKARGDPELPEELEGRVDNFNKVTRCAVISITASMISSLVLWAVGLCMFFFKDLSQCDEVRRWVRLMTWVRILMPFFLLCCIIPVQQLCCQ